MPKEIKLGALTQHLQNNSTPSPLSQSSTLNSSDTLCRIQLTEENKSRIDLLRFNPNIEFVSRTQFVNMIIERYFEQNAQDLEKNIQELLKNL